MDRTAEAYPNLNKLPLMVEVDASGDQHDEDRRDDPVDHKTERQPPPTMRQSG
jgi:hypothetical protein